MIACGAVLQVHGCSLCGAGFLFPEEPLLQLGVRRASSLQVDLRQQLGVSGFGGQRFAF